MDTNQDDGLGFVPTPPDDGLGFVPSSGGTATAQDDGLGFVPETDNAKKLGFSLIGGGAQGIASMGKGLSVLSDPGPMPNNFRTHEQTMLRAGQDYTSPEEAFGSLSAEHEAQRQRLMAPGKAFEQAVAPYAQGANAIAKETPGNEKLAKAADVVGNMLPLLGVAAIPVVGPEAAGGLGGLQATGDTFEQAFQAYKQQGLGDEETRKRAQDDAIKTGITSGTLYTMLPGAGKASAERLLAKQLTSASPTIQAAVRTLAQGADGSMVMGANSLLTSAQAMQTHNPNMTWGDALNEAAKSAAIGFIASAAPHAFIEGAKLPGRMATPEESPQPIQKPLATVNDAIGAKLDEIKALLQQTKGTSDEQAPTETTPIQQGAEPDQPTGIGELRAPDETATPEAGANPLEANPAQPVELLADNPVSNQMTIETSKGKRRIVVRAKTDATSGQYQIGKITVHNDETGAYDIFTPPPSKKFDTPEQAETAGLNLAQVALGKNKAISQPVQTGEAAGAENPVGEQPSTVGDQSVNKMEEPSSITEQGVKFIEEQANRARQRIANRSGITFGSGPLHEIPNIADWGIVGAAKLARGVYDFGKWSGEMIGEFGEKIKPVLRQVYQASIDHLKDTAKQFNPAKSDILKQIESELIAKPKDEPIKVGQKAALKEVLRKSQAAGEAGRAAGVIEGRQSAQPKLDALNEQLSQSVSKARALKDYFFGQQTASEGAARATRENLAVADRWLQADSNSIRARLLNSVEDMPVSERGKFTARIAQAIERPPLIRRDVDNWYRRAFNLMGDMKAHADEVYRKGLADDIKDMVRKSIASPSVDLDYKRAISQAVGRASLVKPTEATLSSLRSTRDFLNRMMAEGKPTNVPDEIINRLDLLNRTPLKDLPVDTLEAMHDEVKHLSELGRRKLQARQNVWEMTRNDKLSELHGQETVPLEKRPELRPQPGEKATFSMRLQNVLRRATNISKYIDHSLLTMDAVMDLLEGGKAKYSGWLFKHLRGPFDLRFNLMLNQRDGIIRPLDEIIKRNQLNKQSSERVGAYALLQQEGGRARLLAQGVTPETIAKIENSLSPAERQAYDYMRRAMDANLPGVQKLMHRLYNLEVKPVKNYFPMQRDHAVMESPPEGTLDPHTGQPITYDKAAAQDWVEKVFVRPTTTAEQGFTIERKPDAMTPVKYDAFQVFNQHIQDMTHLLNSQEYLKMSGEMVRSDLFRAKYGNAGQKLMLDWLDTIARQGGVNSYQRIQWMDTLRRNISKGMVGFRPSSNLVHASNSALAATHIGADWYAKGLVAALSQEGKAFLAKNFREIAERAGGEPAQAELKDSKIARLGFLPARYLDQLQAAGTTLGGYMRELSGKGLDPNQYHALPLDATAAEMARVRARRAIASPQRQDVPQAISRGNLTGGNVSLGQTMFQFQNIFLDHWSNIRLDMWKAGIMEKNPKLAAKMFVGLAALLATETGIKYGMKQAMNAVTGAIPKKPDDFETQMLVHGLHKIPFTGQLSSQAIYGESGIPLLDNLTQTTKAAYGAATAKKDATRTKDMIKAAGGIGGLLGIPGSGQAADLATKLVK